MMNKKNDRHWPVLGRIISKNFKEVSTFSAVGCSNVCIAFLVYYLLTYCKIHYAIANTASFIVSTGNAYYWNTRYVFKSNPPGALLKVYIVYAVTFLLNTFMLYVMIDILAISKYLAPLINVLLITPINYLLNKYWAVKKVE